MNVVYFPVKLAVGVAGAVLGGVGGFLTGGNRRTAEGIWKPMTGGTYFITPEIIDGQQPFLPLDGGPYLPPKRRPASASQMYQQQLQGVQPFLPFVHGGRNTPLPAGPLPAAPDTTS